MNARVIILCLTVSLTLLMMVPTAGLANGEPNISYQPPSAKSFQYDRQMVKDALTKHKAGAEVFPYTVLSWRPRL